jgi:hypothetical protein
MHRFMVKIKLGRIFKRILKSWNPAKNAKRFAKSGGRKIPRFRVNHARINHDGPLTALYLALRVGGIWPGAPIVRSGSGADEATLRTLLDLNGGFRILKHASGLKTLMAVALVLGKRRREGFQFLLALRTDLTIK